jgi:hypothetical protein
LIGSTETTIGSDIEIDGEATDATAEEEDDDEERAFSIVDFVEASCCSFIRISP